MTAMLERYEALVATGELRSDPEQAAAAERLNQLQREVYKAQTSTGFLGKLLGKKAPPRAVSTCGAVWGAASRC